MSDVDVAYIAELARLELTAEEIARLQSDVESILGHVRELQEVDVDGVEPTAHAAQVTNVFREDVAVPQDIRERVLENAPIVVEDGLIQVPKVLAGEEGA